MAALGTNKINGLNLYSYCFNNPIMYTDNTGMWPVDSLNHAVDLLETIFSSLGKSMLRQSAKLFAAASKMPMYDIAAAAKIPMSYTGLARNVFNPKWMNTFDDATNLAYKGGLSKAAGKVLKGIGVALLVADLYMSANANFTNNSLTQTQKFAYTTVDWAISLGTFALASSIGGPIGFIVGVGIWALCEFTGVDEWLKEKTTIIFDAIANGWNNFWDWVF